MTGLLVVAPLKKGTTGYPVEIFVVLALSVALRLWSLDLPPSYLGDETRQVPAAREYLKAGHADSFWHHPHFALLLINLGIRTAGDNPYGWRIRNVLFGSLSAVLLSMIAWELFGERRTAFLAGLLLSMDPLHISLSRTTFDEIPAGFFFLSAAFLVLRWARGSRNVLLPAGMAVGFSIASKAYFVLSAAVLAAFVMRFRKNDKGQSLQDQVRVGLLFSLIPIAVYVLSYVPWFGRGYGPGEFLDLLLDSHKDLSALTPEWFSSYFVLKEGGSPSSWFAVPHVIGYEVMRSTANGVFLVLMNDPPVWLLAWPAFIYFCYKDLKERNAAQFLWAALFIAAYIPLIILSRPIFLYSSVVLLPFAMLFIACMLNAFLQRPFVGIWAYPVLVFLILLWGAYIYPLVTFRDIPLSLYNPLLLSIKIFPPGYWSCQ